MKLTELSVCNVGGVGTANLHIPPDAQVIVITGINGSGKSSMIGSLKYLLTNKVPTWWETKEKFQRTLPDNSLAADAAISGTFSLSDGRSMKITSQLGAGKWALACGDVQVTGAKAVMEQREKQLGVSPELLERYAVVEQTKLRSTLFGSAAKITSELQQLFGLGKYEEWRKAIHALLSSIEAPDLQDAVKTAQEGVNELEEALRSNEAAKAEHEATVAGIDHVLHKAVLSAYKQAEEDKRSLAMYRNTLASVLSKVTSVGNELQEQLSKPEMREGEEAACVAEIQRASAVVDVLYTAFNAWKKEQEARSKLEELLSDSPCPAGKNVDLSEYEAALARLSAELEAANKQKAAEDSGAPGVCTRCGKTCTSCTTAVVDSGVKQRIAELTKDIGLLTSYYDKAKKEKQLFDDSLLAIKLRNRAIEEVKASIPDTPSKAVDTAELTAAKGAVDTAYNKLTKCRVIMARTKELQQQFLDLGKEKEALASIIASYEAKEAGAVSREEADKAQAYLDLYKTASDKVSQYIASGDTLRKLLGLRKAALLDLLASQEENDKKREYKRQLEIMKDVLHRERLPLRLMRGYMQMVVDVANSLLPQFGATFTLYINEDSFWARKIDGTCVPTTILSGGEAVRWCMSFLLAVHELFAADLGILVLDEPTDGLDKAGIQAMVDVLSDMHGILKRGTTQLFIATHELSLAAAADHSIDMNEENKKE